MQDKETIILEATLKLLVERGFYATPVSEIARQSKLSVGIIYHYFENKEALIRQLYFHIKKRFIMALLAGVPDHLGGLEVLKKVWFNAFTYYVEHPLDTLFLEQYENSPYFIFNPDESFAPEFDLFVSKLQHDIENGVYANLPLLVFYDMTLGVAMSLAKRQIAKMIELDSVALEKIADAVYRSVQAV